MATNNSLIINLELRFKNLTCASSQMHKIFVLLRRREQLQIKGGKCRDLNSFTTYK